MRFVSLFAGIGGIDLGLERAGHTCVGQVEIHDYANRVLAKHWPNTPRIRDVREFQGDEFGEFDLLTGGYPCQPFSYAGNRGGEHDPRHLWPEVHRIIRNVRPRYVLLENVPGHLSLGFGRVLGDLAESGYDARWDCIPAAAVGAPHLRDRVFIIGQRASTMANSDNLGCVHRQVEEYAAGGRVNAQCDVRSSGATLADATSSTRGQSQSHSMETRNRPSKPRKRSGKPRPISNWWKVEPDLGRVAHGIPNRVDRLRGLGNAVVPQVAEWIAKNWLPK